MLCKGCSRDVILILISSFFYMACPMVVTPLITGYSGSLGASAAVMGIIGGLTNICSLLCRPLVGNLADRVSKYRLSFVGAVLVTAACVGYIAAENPLVVIVSRIVNGVGFACCSVCMSTWMSNMLPKEKIGSGMGLYGAMNALAMAIAPAVGVSVYQKFGYRAALVIAAYVGLDLGMALGPVVGGVLYGYFPIEYFYPILAVTVPLIILVYWLNRRRL
jgi:MFS family permease